MSHEQDFLQKHFQINQFFFMFYGTHALNYFASLGIFMCKGRRTQNHRKILPFTAAHTYVAHTLHPDPPPGVDRITVHMDHLHRNIRTQLDKSIYDTNNTHDGCWHQHSCVESCKNKIGMWHTYRQKSSAIKYKVKWTCFSIWQQMDLPSQAK